MLDGMMLVGIALTGASLLFVVWASVTNRAGFEVDDVSEEEWKRWSG